MLKIIGKIIIADRVIIPFVRDDMSDFEYYFDHNECQLCHTVRHRRELWIAEIDHTRYVCGKECLNKLYTKDVIANAIAAAKKEQENIRKYCYNVVDLIVGGLYQRECYGYVIDRSSRDFKANADEYIDKGYESHTKDFRSIAKEIVGWYSQYKVANTFEQSCKTIASNEYATAKILGLIPSLVNIYYAGQGIATNGSAFFGNEHEKYVGLRIAGTIVDIRETTHTPYYYSDDGRGIQTVIKDRNNHVFVWNNTVTKNNREAKIGESVVLTRFTVNKHFESKKYGKCTKITRLCYDFDKEY